MVVYTDDFNRANTSSGAGLGSIPNGPVWQQLSGSWRIYNNRANTTTSKSNNPISVADFTLPDGDISADVGYAGDAIYFRVQDVNNWMRARTHGWTTTTSEEVPVYDTRQVPVYDTRQVSVKKTEYEYRERTSYRDDYYTCNYGDSYNHGHNGHSHSYDSSWTSRNHGGRNDSARLSSQSAYSASYACWAGINHSHNDYPQHIHYFTNGYWQQRYDYYIYGSYYWAESKRQSSDTGPHDSRQVHDYYEEETYISHYETETYISHYETETTTHYHYRVYLEKMVGGSLTSISYATTSAANSMRVYFSGSTIRVYVNGTLEIDTTDVANLNNTKHGIGRGTSTRDNHSIDNFSVDIPNTAPGTPTSLTASADASGVAEFSAAASDSDGHDVRIRFHVQSASGFSEYVWSDYVAPGVTATASITDLPEDDYTVEAQAYDALDVAGSTSAAQSFSVNIPPGAPTLVSPATDATLRRDITQTFEWSVNDPSGTPQSGFDIRFRPVGGVWTTYNRTSTDTFFDISAAQFPVGPMEWQVRTYDDVGLVGDWSDIAAGQFLYNTPPNMPTNLRQTDTGPTLRPTFAADISDFDTDDILTPEVELRNMAGEVIDSFSLASIPVADGSMSHTMGYDLTESDYEVRVRVTDTNLGVSAWTSWVALHTNYAPNPPTLVSPAFIENAELNNDTFDWEFSDDDTGDNETEWALQREAYDTGQITWWDATEGTWTSTETWNDSATSDAVVIDSENFPVGTEWEWTVNTRDGLGVESGYATPVFFYAGTAIEESDDATGVDNSSLVVVRPANDSLKAVEDATPAPDVPPSEEIARGNDDTVVSVELSVSDSVEFLDEISGAGSYVLSTLQKSPVGFWRLGDTGTQAEDFSGQRHHGVYVGSVQQGADSIINDDNNSSVVFQGGHVELDSTFAYLFDRLTIDGWISGRGVLLSSKDLTVNYDEHGLEVRVVDDFIVVTPEREVSYFAITFNGGVLSIYANGEFLGSNSVPAESVNLDGLRFGSVGAGFNRDVYEDDYVDIYEIETGSAFDGKMDELVLYNYDLSAGEIAEQFEEGVYGLESSDGVVLDDGADIESTLGVADEGMLSDDESGGAVISDADSVEFVDFGMAYIEEMESVDTGTSSSDEDVVASVTDGDNVEFVESQSVSSEYYGGDSFDAESETASLSADIFVSDGAEAADDEGLQEYKFVSDSFEVEESESYSEYNLMNVGDGYTVNIRREPYLVSLWRMNSSNNVRDESGRQNDLVEHNLSLGKPLISGDLASVVFDGVSSYLDVAESDWHRFGRNSFTVEFWIDAASGTIIERDSGWSIWIENGDLHASMTDKNGSTASGVIQSGLTGPNHVVVVFDRGVNTLYAYINGRGSDGSVYIGGLKSLDHDARTITAGNGGGGYLSGRIGEIALIASSVSRKSATNRYISRLNTIWIDAFMEGTLPYAYFRMERDEFIDAEISDYTLDGFTYAPTDSIVWSDRDSIDVISGGVDIAPFDVKTIEFTAVPNSTTDQLVYHHTDANGDTMDIYIREGVVTIEESYGGIVNSESINFEGDRVHVGARLDENASEYFINGFPERIIAVESRASIASIRLFSMDATANFTGVIDHVYLHDELLGDVDITENYNIVNSGRNHFRVYDIDGAAVTESGYKPYVHDWVTVTA